MAECLLLKSGGQTKKLPVLNASYPANVTNWQGEQATFRVEIATAGVPAEYTYQWYRDGAKWTEATNATVSWSGASIGSHSIYCVVTNKAGEVTSRVATLTVKDPNMAYTYSGSHREDRRRERQLAHQVQEQRHVEVYQPWQVGRQAGRVLRGRRLARAAAATGTRTTATARRAAADTPRPRRAFR